MEENKNDKHSRLAFKDYLIVNAIFIAFCTLQLLFIKWFVKDLSGVLFFFAVLIIGFVVVSAFDYLFDFFSEKRKKISK